MTTQEKGEGCSMKKFEFPLMEIEKFNIADVITASTTCEWYCEDDPLCTTNVTKPFSL